MKVCWWIGCVLLLGMMGCSLRGIPSQEPASEPSAEVASEVPAEVAEEAVMEASDAGPEVAPERTPEPPPERRPAPDIPPVPKYPTDGYAATVVHVTDGDTVYVVMKPGGWASRVRLKGVNAPECYKETNSNNSFQHCSKDKEFFGLQSYTILKDLMAGGARRVTLSCVMKGDACEKDEFDRFLAYLKMPDGRDVGEAVIEAGAAWSFTRYESAKVASYCRAEASAIRNKKGMWAKGRAYVRQRMSKAVRSWYDRHKPNHDAVCSDAMKESFSKAAGE